MDNNNLERCRRAWERQKHELQRTPFLSDEELHSLVGSGRQPQLQQRLRACVRTLAAHLVTTLCGSLLLTQALHVGSLPAAVLAALLLAVLLVAVAAAAYELLLLLMLRRYRFHPSRMEPYAVRLRRLTSRRLRLFRAMPSCKDRAADTLLSLRPRLAAAASCLALLTSTAFYLTIDSPKVPDEMLLAANEAVVPALPPSTAPANDIQPVAAAPAGTHKRNEASRHSRPTPATAPADEPAESPADTPSDIAAAKEARLAELLAAARDSETTTVMCNSNDCSAEKYCAIAYESLLNS